MEKKDHTQVHSNLFSSARWHYLNAIIRNRLFTYLEECAIFKLLNKVSILLIIWFLKCSACSIQSTATGSVESFDVAGATSPTGGTFIDFTWRQAKVAPNLKFISTFFSRFGRITFPETFGADGTWRQVDGVESRCLRQLCHCAISS